MVNLNGTWLGTYWQRGLPTRFELTLLQAGNSLNGNILDDNSLGEASVVGEVIGRRITFRKCYIVGTRHCVDYTGIIAETEDCMTGEWQVGLFDSGPWEAYRTEDNLSLNVEISRREKIYVSVD
jgi:hypothetical protein